VPEGPNGERFLFLSDVLPTSWQAVEYANVPDGGTLAVFGLGPIGQMCCRIALARGAERVFGIDLVPERLQMAARHGVETIDTSQVDNVPAYIREQTHGRGPDGVIDAVGMEAHGAPVQEVMQKSAGLLPDAISQKVIPKVGVDRLAALMAAIETVRRGGTISIIGVYGGQTDPMPMLRMFDKGVTIAMGQAHSSAGYRTSCRTSWTMPIHSAPRTCARIGCRWTMRRTATRFSRRSRTARSRSC
jgi:hypothetical protein